MDILFDTSSLKLTIGVTALLACSFIGASLIVSKYWTNTAPAIIVDENSNELPKLELVDQSQETKHSFHQINASEVEEGVSQSDTLLDISSTKTLIDNLQQQLQDVSKTLEATKEAYAIYVYSHIKNRLKLLLETDLKNKVPGRSWLCERIQDNPEINNQLNTLLAKFVNSFVNLDQTASYIVSNPLLQNRFLRDALDFVYYQELQKTSTLSAEMLSQMLSFSTLYPFL